MLDATTNFGPMYVTFQGIDDFAGYVFESLTSGLLTETQAANLFEYTDGYRMAITSTYAGTATSSSSFCFKKTGSQGVVFEDGSICIEATGGMVTHLGYYGGITSDTGYVQTSSSLWPVQLVSPMSLC